MKAPKAKRHRSVLEGSETEEKPHLPPAVCILTLLLPTIQNPVLSGRYGPRAAHCLGLCVFSLHLEAKAFRGPAEARSWAPPWWQGSLEPFHPVGIEVTSFCNSLRLVFPSLQVSKHKSLQRSPSSKHSLSRRKKENKTHHTTFPTQPC